MRQHSIPLTNAAAAPVARPVEDNGRTEWGRRAILSGCIMAMVGMVTYCYGSLESGPESDIASALFGNGMIGWAAFVLLVTGVGIWMAGNVALLVEADRAETER